jgi:hypothetical protein
VETESPTTASAFPLASYLVHRGLSSEEVGKLPSWIACEVIDRQRRGVAEYFPHQAMTQTLEVPNLNMLDLIAVEEVTEIGLDAIANSTLISAALRGRILVGCV